jgi:hypothetical protein
MQVIQEVANARFSIKARKKIEHDVSADTGCF